MGLATKALILQSPNEKQIQFDEEGRIIIPDFENRVIETIEVSNNEPQQLIEEFNIKEFKACKSWFCRYMFHHALSYRKVHYERRGIINEKQVDVYLTEIV